MEVLAALLGSAYLLGLCLLASVAVIDAWRRRELPEDEDSG